LTRETWINLFNGAALYPIRLLLGLLGVTSIHIGLVPLGTLGHPVLQFLFTFLVLDFTRYWVHRADHRVPFLWKFHKVHHSVEALDATAGFRMHLFDFVQLTAIPVVLFGVLFDVSHFEPWVMPAALIVGILADSAEHANVRFPLDTWWRKLWFQLFNNPLFHSWHHVRDGHICDGNYANALPLWDRLFGSDVTRTEPPLLYGLEQSRALDRSFVGMHLLRPRPPEEASPGVSAMGA
jgi:sterol desaturase/sphingolipid hydroxylase (fatty acid hydroxylase superfamily)